MRVKLSRVKNIHIGISWQAWRIQTLKIFRKILTDLKTPKGVREQRRPEGTWILQTMKTCLNPKKASPLAPTM